MSWLDDLKVGDTIVIRIGHNRVLDKVKRTTKTQIIVGTAKYNKKNGCSIPYNAWDNNYICEATEDKIAKIKLDHIILQLKDKINKKTINSLSLEKLKLINEIIEARE